ncbi:MAG: SDR family NAD(P)-dependent oxidoreductase, partial [Limnochordia bacterium]
LSGRDGTLKEPADKVAIITGAGRGIGLGIAQYFAQRGYRVVIAENNPTTGQEAENTITAEGGKAVFIHTAVRNEDSVEKMVEQIQARWQRIDVLINNAAIGFTKHPCLLALARTVERSPHGPLFMC